MAYATHSYLTKQAFEADLALGPVPVYQDGPNGPRVPNGVAIISGPGEWPMFKQTWHSRVLILGSMATKLVS